MATENTTPYTELMFQIEAVLEDMPDDKHGAMRALKLGDMLDSAMRAAKAKRAELLATRDGDRTNAGHYQKLTSKHLEQMRSDYEHMLLLIDKEARRAQNT